MALLMTGRMVEVRICGGPAYGPPEEREPACFEQGMPDSGVSHEAARLYARSQAAEQEQA